MQPVLSTLPNSALPPAKKPTADGLLRAAGLMIVTPNGEALFLRYSSDHDHAGEWAWPAGGLEGDEEARDAAIRETREETGWIPNEEIKEVDSSQDEVDFTTFTTTSNNQFIPELSSEHDSWCWAPLSNPPEPLHPGAAKTLKGIADTDEIMDVVAQDQKPIAHSGAANIASRSELNSIGLPKTQPQSRAINIAFKNGGTAGPEAKQSGETNRFIDSGGLTEHDRERTGKSKAVLGKDEVKKEASRGRFFDGKDDKIERRLARLAQRRGDAEYVEKPHIGRLPPREAERLSRDEEDAEDYRSERGFVAKLTDEKGSTIETSPLMISRNSAQKWLDEKSAKLKRLGRAVQGTIRESFMDPAYINADAKNTFRVSTAEGDTYTIEADTLAEAQREARENEGGKRHTVVEEASRKYSPGKIVGGKYTTHDAIAFDEGSVRTTDPDGRLHVATTNISKAVVNPYKGSEIPDYEKLGLEPDKIYQLYRDPDELAKAAPTFNNLPLLKQHVPITADTHKPELVWGSTGTDASFEYPYLKNSLVLWSKDAIKAVESGKQKELSSAYRYTADMTPGVWEDPETGEKKPYDGVMRNIVGNHLAAVREGRAGHDVVVGDSANPELVAGKRKKRRPMGQMTKVAANTALMLSAYIRPKLAQDQKVNLLPVVEGLTAKNFDERRSRIIREVRKLTKGKLANDASIGEIAEVLDLLEAHPDTGEDAPVTDVQEAMMSEMTDVPGASNVSGQGSPGGDRRGARDNRRARDTSYDRRARDRRARDNFPPHDREDDRDQEGEDRRGARDADPTAAVEAFLKDKVSGSDLQHVCNLMRGGGEDDSPGNDSDHAEGEEQLEELGASHGAEDDPPRAEISDIERSREWHVGEGEAPPGGGGHPGKTVQDRRAAEDRRRAQDRRGAKDRKRAHDEPPPFKGMPKVGEGPMDKRAMDQAIKVSVEQAIKNQQLIRQAERDVRPWVGELAMDSATCPEDVYAAALKAKNIKIDGVHPSAYSVILKNLPLPGQQANRGSSPRVAMDAASRASFSERFPSVGRIGLL